MLLGYRIPLALGNDRGLKWGTVHFLDWTSLKDHCGLQYHQKMCWYHWSILLAQTWMKPEIQVEVCSLGDILRLGCLRSHAGMSGLFNHLRPWGDRLLVPAALRVMSRSWYSQGPCWWPHVVRATEATAWLSLADGFWHGCRQRMTHPFLGGCPLGIWSCSSEYMDHTKWAFFSFLSFLGDGGRVLLERWLSG